VATRPDADGFARFAIWGGALLIAGAYSLDALIDLRNEWLWLVNGLFFIFLGLSMLPKHPRHYLDFDDAAEVETQKSAWRSRTD
jgi:hypothetical protein